MRLPAFNNRWWLLLIWLLPAWGAEWTVARAPLWLEPSNLLVTLEPSQTVMLGRNELAAPQADTEHVRIRRDPQGNWWLANLAIHKQVLWQPIQEWADQSIREWRLAPNTSFVVGAHSFAVLEVGSGRLTLKNDQRHWEYDGLRLRLDGRLLPECHENWRTGLRHRLSNLPLLRNLFQRPLRLGGGVYCADRLGLSEVPIDTAALAPVGSGFVLRPGWAGRLDGTLVVVAVGTAEAESLWRRSIQLAVGDQLIIGRTQYQVAQTGSVLELTVLGRAWRRLATSPSPHHSPVVTIQWQPINWWWPPGPNGWRWPFGLGLAALTLGLVGWYATLFFQSPYLNTPFPCSLNTNVWQGVGSLALAGMCLGMHLSIQVTPILWPYLLALPVLGLWLMTVRSAWSAGLLATLTLLLGLGLVTLLQLGAGAEESGWPRYGSSGAALAGAFGWLAWALRAYRQDGHRWFGGLTLRSIRWGQRLLVSGALMLLIMQMLFGDESGWAGFQPFELIKLALTVAAAYGLMSGMRPKIGNGNPDQRWLGWRALIPVTLLLTMSGFALLFLRDFSPIALLSIWVLALAWAWARIHPQRYWRRWGRGVVIFLALSVVGGLAWLYQHPEDFPLDLQIDRVRAWVAPEQHPHAGYQLRQALEAIQAGDWWGTIRDDSANGRVMGIPAVENDFTPAFFLNRYGGLAGLTLVAIQALLISFLLIIADRALYPTGSEEDRLAGKFIYFTLYGGAALLGAHFLISWGANLGFLPVMGQPMSLLSSAGSHLVLFVLPVVALAIAIEEKQFNLRPTNDAFDRKPRDC